MRTALNVARTLAKFARGNSHGRDVGADTANAMAAFGYLVGRKLSLGGRSTLRLGFGERRHLWDITRREDLMVLEEVFLDEEYALDITPPTTVLDLGANFGAASVYFALRWPQARIFAVEPSPEMFARLGQIASCYENIRCLPYAIAAADGVMAFGVSRSSVGSGFFAHEPAQRIDVPVRSLSSLLAECGVERVGLLKFDIEGAEALLVEDGAALARVDAFVGEIHPDLMQVPVNDLLARFAAFDTHSEPLAGGRFMLRGTRVSR